MSLKIMYWNYKDAESLFIFIYFYFFSILITFFYFFIFFIFLPFIFLYTFLCMLINIFVYKKAFKVENVYLYTWEKKNSILTVFKYYLFDIIIQYSYLIIYILIHLFKTNSYLIFLKALFSKIFNFLFIYVFGFPVFFIDITNKLYTRLKNSFDEFNFNKTKFILNLNSMLFFDFSNHLYIEELSISISSCVRSES